MLRRAVAFGVAFGLFIALAPSATAEAEGAVTPETVAEELDGVPSANDPPPEDVSTNGEDGADAAPGTDDATALASEQPTISQPVETPIPFTMLGAELPKGAEVWVRTSEDGQKWTEWVELQALGEDQEGPDAGSDEDLAASETWRQMTDPVWVGTATWLQLTVQGSSSEDVTLTLIDSMGLSRTITQRVRDAISAVFQGAGATAQASVRPAIITRSQWGANESWRGSPSYASDVNGVVVHHTAGSNNYTPDQAPGIVRAIYHYHTQTLGWRDIGYNMLVDRYGRMYEGRYGGLEYPVIGAHAGGFNTGTFGISVLGDFQNIAPTSAAFEAVAEAVAWKTDLHNINPHGRVTLTSRGSTRYPSGQRVTLPTIFGHLDVSATLCPGREFYNRLPTLRDRVAAYKKAGWAYPLSGDWNGDGRATPGWFQDGRVYLRNSNSAGPADIVFNYGRRGDVPVAGDWNGNGIDTLGVRRGPTWYLTNRNAGGAPAATFNYGRASDVPVVGDWNGNGRTTVGVMRGSTWYLSNRTAAGAPRYTFNYGWAGDVPVAGDWNGNGVDTVGVRRGSTWYLSNRTAAGAPAATFNYGRGGDVPLVGDWNRNGQSTPGVVRGAIWYLTNRTSAGTPALHYGYSG